jgi:cytochrome c oxidase assembly factor 4
VLVKMSNDQTKAAAAKAVEDDDGPDEWCVELMGSASWLGRRGKDAADKSCRDKRIFSTGCAGEAFGDAHSVERSAYEFADENAKLTDCYYEKKDWRACKQEVGGGPVGQAALSRDGADAAIYLCNNMTDDLFRWRFSENAGRDMVMIQGRVPKTDHELKDCHHSTEHNCAVKKKLVPILLELYVCPGRID